MKAQKIWGLLLIGVGIYCFYAIFLMIFIDFEIENLFAIPFFLIVGIIFTAFGRFLLNKDKIRKNDKEKRQIQITTKYKEIKTESYDSITDYYIITSWVNPEDNKLYLFKSEEVGRNAEKIIQDKKITEFKVSYEPNNIENYEVDISTIKEVENEKNK